jgi:hypothetical protein
MWGSFHNVELGAARIPRWALEAWPLFACIGAIVVLALVLLTRPVTRRVRRITDGFGARLSPRSSRGRSGTPDDPLVKRVRRRRHGHRRPYAGDSDGFEYLMNPHP